MKPIPTPVLITFLTLVLATAMAVVAVFRKPIRNYPGKGKYVPLLVLAGLLLAFSILALNNVFIDTIKNTPPAFMPAVGSLAVLMIYFSLFYKPLQNLPADRMKYAVALQTFRLPLELMFIWFMSLNLMPVQMTFEGRNPDILIGITAPLVAYFGYHKKILPRWSLILWNFAGLVTLFNIVTIAILSAPTNFQVFTNEPHNTLVMYFPYVFIPFFLVPLALFGHLYYLKRLFT